MRHAYLSSLVMDDHAEIVRELRELSIEKKRLQMPAYLWERHAGDTCDGECDRPVVIAVSGSFELTCCEFIASASALKQVMTVERVLRNKKAALENGAKAQALITELTYRDRKLAA